MFFNHKGPLTADDYVTDTEDGVGELNPLTGVNPLTDEDREILNVVLLDIGKHDLDKKRGKMGKMLKTVRRNFEG